MNIERVRAIDQCKEAINEAISDYVGLFEVYEDMTDEMAKSIILYMEQIRDSIK